MQKLFIIFCIAFIATQVASAAPPLLSPDGKILVSVNIQDKQIKYTISYNGVQVLQPSKLGLMLTGIDFTKNLHLLKTSPVTSITDNYSMVYAKKKNMQYRARQVIYTFANSVNQKFNIIFRVSNDGVVFRYQFLGKNESRTVQSENTTYHFPTDARAFVQPMSVAKTGWEQTNPSYEEHYYQDVPVGTVSKLGAGFVYPALFITNKAWVLITEAAVEPDWCGTRLNCDNGNSEYKVTFPDPREIIFDKNLLPKQTMQGYSPWRVITIGPLKTIIESTLGTDVALPSRIKNNSFVKPGKASWSWINSKDDFIVYDEQVKYIDFAAAMNWQYCLIDVNWDWKIGFEKMQELVNYAKSKNVGLILWYNSAGDWNTVKYTPKNKLLTKESREKEFAMLQKMGVKGVKIDFFGGDGQSVIQYYHDILKDAGRFQLLVNFHGATLPRGWSRTYPHLVTVEAVKGFEFITFGQADADLAANHCAMLPFTRNVFDPMDFTPTNLYKMQSSVKRRTTAAFELATSVLFLSGVQHFAESPEGIKEVPEFGKKFLKELPNSWDDVKFIDGYPGKLAVIARKSQKKWFIAGINGENISKKLNLNLSFLRNKKVTIISHHPQNILKEKTIVIPSSGNLQLNIDGNDGFVIVSV